MPDLELLRTQVFVRQSALDQAESQVTQARLRVHSLSTQKQVVEANRPKNTPTRNPQWDLLQTELRSAEGIARRLTEKLAPAHPEMQAANAEVQSIKEKLAVIPEYLNTSIGTGSYDSFDLDAETRLTAEILRAEQELKQAEGGWRAANREYQRALAELAAWKPAPVVVPDISTKSKEIAHSQAWPLWAAGGVLIFLTGAIICRLAPNRTDTSRGKPQAQGQSATRIIYPTYPITRRTASSMPVRLDSPPSLPNRRTPIIPRRRTVSID